MADCSASAARPLLGSGITKAAILAASEEELMEALAARSLLYIAPGEGIYKEELHSPLPGKQQAAASRRRTALAGRIMRADRSRMSIGPADTPSAGPSTCETPTTTTLPAFEVPKMGAMEDDERAQQVLPGSASAYVSVSASVVLRTVWWWGILQWVRSWTIRLSGGSLRRRGVTGGVPLWMASLISSLLVLALCPQEPSAPTITELARAGERILALQAMVDAQRVASHAQAVSGAVLLQMATECGEGRSHG